MIKRDGSNEGNVSSLYHGENPVSDRDYIKRYLSDTFLIKEGMVIDVFPERNVCQVNYAGGTTEAIWLTKSYPGLFSCIDAMMPTIGTRVLIYNSYGSDPAIILGFLPKRDVHYGNSINIENAKVDVTTESQHELADNSELSNFNSDVPQDLFPGEWVIVNELGNLIGLLRGMAIIKGTDLAQMQFGIIDNLVRLISGTAFEHISAAHDVTEYNSQGFLSIESDFYRIQSDSFGTDDSLVKKGEFYIEEPKDVTPKPLMRLHVGHIGNLMKLYIIRQDESNPVPIAIININSDGRLNVQSTEEIELAIKKKLFLPQRVKPYHEETEYDEEILEHFEYNENYRKDLQEIDKQKWELKRDKNSYDNANWEIHQTEENESESSFLLRKDGSFCLISNESTFSIDKDGNALLSCKGDFNIKCKGSMNAIVGEHINFKTKDDIDLHSDEGHLRLAANESCIVRTEKQGVLIETNSDTTEDGKFSGIIERCLKASSITMESKLNIVSICDNHILNIAGNKIRNQSKELEWDVESALCKIENEFKIETQEMNIITDLYKNKYTRCEMTGVGFVISGSAFGKIHGGESTDINHTHPRNEWRYKPDPCGGMHGISIKKTNNVSNLDIPSSELTQLDILMEPFTEKYIDTILYKFRETPYEKAIYEDKWQEGLSWDLLQNEINNTCSFPGKEYNKYYEYKQNEETKQTSGEFISKAIKEYGNSAPVEEKKEESVEEETNNDWKTTDGDTFEW